MAEGARPNLLGGHADVGFDKNSPLKVIPLDVNAMGDADRNRRIRT